MRSVWALLQGYAYCAGISATLRGGGTAHFGRTTAPLTLQDDEFRRLLDSVFGSREFSGGCVDVSMRTGMSATEEPRFMFRVSPCSLWPALAIRRYRQARGAGLQRIHIARQREHAAFRYRRSFQGFALRRNDRRNSAAISVGVAAAIWTKDNLVRWSRLRNAVQRDVKKGVVATGWH